MMDTDTLPLKPIILKRTTQTLLAYDIKFSETYKTNQQILRNFKIKDYYLFLD